LEDKLSFLSGGTPAETVTPEPVVEPTPEPTPDGPLRGPDGKFAAASPEPAPEPAPAPAPVPEPTPAAPPPEPGHVPISAMLDEREKRQALEREIADLRKNAQPAPAGPDPFEDPAAYTQQVALNIKLDLSEDMARGKHGDEVVNQARDWVMAKMGESPTFRDEVLSNRNPYEFAVQAWQRDQVVSQLQPSDLAAFKAWQAAQAALATTPQAAPAAPPAPVVPPPASLAAAPSAGGAAHVPIGEGQAFDSVFRK
jgi:hypothetical protein